ncbi:MAG: hypothetical protein ABJH04_11355 [Cyclobacteriaceae bacterium]
MTEESISITYAATENKILKNRAKWAFNAFGIKIIQWKRNFIIFLRKANSSKATNKKDEKRYGS